MLIGSAGTFDTLTEVFYKIENPAFELGKATEYDLPLSGFYLIFQSLVSMNKQERLGIAGMIPLRADMIVVACCLFNFILKKYDISIIKNSSYALKEGVLIEKYESSI